MDIQRAIDEVAWRHKIRLAEDDPLLATVALTEIIHQAFAEHLKSLVADVANQATDRLAAEIELGRRVIEQENAAAKAAASKLVNDAGAWSAERLKQASAAATEDIRSSVMAGLAAMQAEITAARRVQRVSLGAAIAVVCVGAAFLGGGIGFWMAGH